MTGLELLGLVMLLVMLGAIFIVHLKAGFFAPKGVEFVLLLLAAAVVLVIMGAGRLSVDARLEARSAGNRV